VDWRSRELKRLAWAQRFLQITRLLFTVKVTEDKEKPRNATPIPARDSMQSNVRPYGGNTASAEGDERKRSRRKDIHSSY